MSSSADAGSKAGVGVGLKTPPGVGPDGREFSTGSGAVIALGSRPPAPRRPPLSVVFGPLSVLSVLANDVGKIVGRVDDSVLANEVGTNVEVGSVLEPGSIVGRVLANEVVGNVLEYETVGSVPSAPSVPSEVPSVLREYVVTGSGLVGSEPVEYAVAGSGLVGRLL